MYIKVYDRNKKEYFKEEVSGEKFLDFLYDNRVGELLLEGLVKRKIFQSVAGKYCDSKLSKKNIAAFIKAQKIDITEAIDEASSYRSFNDFFVRKLKPESRKINLDPNVLISPGDGRLLVFENIDKDALIQVKGITYSLSNLLGSDEVSKEFSGGSMAILRLNPSDYHRFHFIDDGIPSEINKINGMYYSVNPVALKKIPSLYLQNRREWCLFKTSNFQDVIVMEVGATSVGSIIQTYTPNQLVKRGDEKGYFKFGGSTTILFFKKDMVTFDQDILENSNDSIECKVKMGEKIGIRRK